MYCVLQVLISTLYLNRQLAKEGYKAVIDSNNDHDLVISKDGAIVATDDSIIKTYLSSMKNSNSLKIQPRKNNP
jgi:ubiquitin C-terminal hydrolase